MTNNLKTDQVEKNMVPKDLAKLLEDGYLLSQEIRQLYQALGVVKSRITLIAEQSNPYRRKTVKLSSGNYNAIIQFKDEKIYFSESMPMIQELIGESKFKDLFKKKVEFKGNYHSLNSFLASITSDPQLNKAKDLINRSTITTILPPYIKFSIDFKKDLPGVNYETGEINEIF